MENNTSYRVRTNIGDKVLNISLDSTCENIDVLSLRLKQSDVYKNYEYEHIRKVDGKEYVMHSAQKGFMTYNGVIEAGGFYSDVPEKPMKENPLTEESLEYLLKIVEYCKDRGIVLTCIGCPISDFQLQANGTYDNYVSQIRILAKEYGFSYYDFIFLFTL